MEAGGRTTRRGVLGAAAAGAAAAALPARVEARRRRRRRQTRRADVVVIGAGFAGLSAARAIAAAGRSVIVLEGQKRVGGRVLNADLGGGKIVELGGQWIGPTQDRLAALAGELGVGVFKTHNQGDNIYYRGNRPEALRHQRFSSSGPFGPVPPDPGVAEIQAALTDLDEKAKTIPRDAPYEAEQAREYDRQTFERLINTAGGAQENRFTGGSQLLTIKMARELGRRVVLGAPVRRIRQRRTEVVVESDRVTVHAQRAIVAMAPALTNRIDFRPAVSAAREQLVQRYPMGSVIKVNAVYDTPFWRDEGLSGQVVGDFDPVRITFDNSPPDGSPGILLGFLEGEQARIWGKRPAAERRDAVLKSFAAYFGERALSPRQYLERDWQAARFTRGGYEGYTGPGVLVDYGDEIRRPHGRVHWAGTETATLWNGYMDGAVRSGERAAAEVLPLLRRRRARRT